VNAGYLRLQEVVAGLRYKAGWKFWLASGATSSSGAVVSLDTAGLAGISTSGGCALLAPPVTLHVTVWTPDSGCPDTRIVLDHQFTAPGASGDWERWLLDRILDVERHEAMEFFSVGGRKVFYPGHGPQARLYDIVRH
jgi:hypothetical protein